MKSVVTSFDSSINDLELVSSEDSSMIRNLKTRVTDHLDECAYVIIEG